MISHTVISSAAGAMSYYKADQQQAQGEYYTKEQAPSRWGGEAASIAQIRLGGEVNPKQFERILNGERLINPATGERQDLGRINKEGEREHRPGFDFTISAPKSVSMVGMIGQDERVLAAHEAAAAKAMAYLESKAETRVRTGNGGIEHRNTGNVLYAAFSHDTSREKDPQIHTHFVVANATYDKQSGQWRSLDPDSMVKASRTADAIYKNELAANLQKLGYETTWTKNGPEIKGVTKEQMEAFSKRSEQIKEALAEHGKTRETASAKERNIATVETRKGKDSTTSREEIAEKWRAEAKAVGFEAGNLVAEARARAEQRQTAVVSPLSAREAVDKAVHHLSEREAAFKRDDVIKAANEFSKGAATSEQINKAIDRAIENRQMVEQKAGGAQKTGLLTTPTAIKRETDMARMVQEGKGKTAGVIDSARLDKQLDKLDQARGFSLNAGQRDAARMVLTSKDQFTAIQGYAGTGKTTMLEAVRNVAERQGYEVVGMSAGAKQAAILERDSGIKSQTVASFLLEKQNERAKAAQGGNKAGAEKSITILGQKFVDKGLGGGGILVSDRAGLAKAAHDLNARAAKAGGLEGLGYRAAGRLGNDLAGWRQASAGEAALARGAMAVRDIAKAATSAYKAATGNGEGKQIWVVDEASQLSQKDMNAIMKEARASGAKVAFVGDKEQHQSVEAGKADDKLQEAGIQRVELTEVNRQKDEVGKAAVRDVLAGDNKAAFDKLTKVEVKDNAQLIDRMAKDYAASEHRERTVIVTATNEDRRAINDAVRGELKAAGVVDEKEASIRSLEKVDMTKAEAKEAWRYEKGMTVQADRGYKSEGIQKGDTFKVQAVDQQKNTVTLQNERTGQTHVWNPEQRTNFSAYQERAIQVSQGDKVRFTQNNHAEGVKNGEVGTVRSVKGGQITVEVNGKDVKLDTSKVQHAQHGYATTSYGAQGDTQTKAMYHINTERSGGVGDRSFYVGATRAKEGTTIYTTDADRARELVDRAQDKTSATVSVEQDQDRGADRSIGRDSDNISQDKGEDKSRDMGSGHSSTDRVTDHGDRAQEKTSATVSGNRDRDRDADRSGSRDGDSKSEDRSESKGEDKDSGRAMTRDSESKDEGMSQGGGRGR
ncbi:MAG: MobF family relaxase [Pseudomonadota bacterium]